MKPWDIVASLAATTKKLEKEAILKTVPADSEFWPGAKMAMDTFQMFGIKKLPKGTVHAESETNLWPEFERLGKKLVDRKLTGHAARDAVTAFAEKCTQKQWSHWYYRILEKDLNCGAGEAILSKFAPEDHKFIPFGVQLAKSMKDIPSERLFRRAHIEAKYDGARTIWFITKAEGTGDEDPFGEDDSFNYSVRCVSRSGKELFNFGAIGSQLGLLTRSRHFPECGLVIDGEVMSASFNQLMTQFRRKDLSETTIDAFLMAFDAVRMDEFLSHSKTPKFDDRRSYLELLIADLHEMLGNVQNPLVIPSIILKNIDPVDQQDIVMEFFEKQVEANFEGIIVKDAEATYEWDRTVNMLKMKPTMTVDLRIIGFTPGRGKFEGTLGALDCEGYDEAGRHITVGVSGISDELRHALWKEGIDNVRGRMVEVMADAVSKNKDGTYSLRFPRFKQFRNDR